MIFLISFASRVIFLPRMYAAAASPARSLLLPTAELQLFFARAVHTEERKEFALAYRKRECVNSGQFAVAFCQIFNYDSVHQLSSLELRARIP